MNIFKNYLGIEIKTNYDIPKDLAYIIPPIPEGFKRLNGENNEDYRTRHMKEHPEMYGKIQLKKE